MSATDETSYISSLYVGDLHKDVTEMTLMKLFGENVVSTCRVVRDNETKRPLGYAYVNFFTHDEAEKTLKNFNQKSCMGKPLRIMWAEKNPDRRRNTAGNLFIKNIDVTVDAKTIYDAFSTFGEILSFKIVTDPNGHSLGYGFIHYARAADAEEVIHRVDGVNFNGKEISVQYLVAKKDRPSVALKYNNLYFKNIEGVSEEDLKKEFEKYGKVTSFFLPVDENNNKRMFGFVCYESCENAASAVEGMHNKAILNSAKPLFVTRALKKNERQAEIQRYREERRLQMYAKHKDKNLYVKNIPDTYTEVEVIELFKGFGTITSCRVMKDAQNRSRMFGFVCFETIEMAQKAKEALNGKPVMNKNLYVSVAQSKEERRYNFAVQYNNMRMNNQANMRGEGNFTAGGRNVQAVGGMNGVPLHAVDRRNVNQPPTMVGMGGFPSMQLSQLARGAGLISQYNQQHPNYSLSQPGFQKNIRGGPFNKTGRKENMNGPGERRHQGREEPVINDVPTDAADPLLEIIKGISSTIMPKSSVESFVALVMNKGDYKNYVTDSKALQDYLRKLFDTMKISEAK